MFLCRQRLLLSLMKYDFSLLFPPGRKLVLADALSRAVHPDSRDKQGLRMLKYTLGGGLAALASETAQDRQKTETQKNTELQYVLHCLAKGTPVQGNFSLLELDLSVINKIIFKGARVMIPLSLRRVMLV